MKTGPKPRPILERALEKVKFTESCWLWTASTAYYGYGQIEAEGKSYRAHRVIYEALVGPIPDDLELDHLCRNPACVNPDHLEPVTHAENVRRGDSGKAQREKTHCKFGHPFDDSNTYIQPNGGRVCRLCRNARVAQWKRDHRQ